MGRGRGGRRLLAVAVGLVVAWLAVGAFAGPASGKLSDVQKNDNAAFLPGNAEATRVQGLIKKFRSRLEAEPAPEPGEEAVARA